MRKPDNTIVFGSQNMSRGSGSTESFPPPPNVKSPSGGFPPPVSTRTESMWFASQPPTSVRTRPLADDLIDERPAYMQHPERGLAFALVSLALIGVAAAGTYFFFGTTEVGLGEPVSEATVTNAQVPAPKTSASAPAPAPTPTTTPPDQPWTPPVVDAVKAPGLSQPPVPREIPGPQVMPTERPQATSGPAAPAPTTYASKIEGRTPAKPTVPKQVPANEQQVDDAALERAGFYKNLMVPPMDARPAPTSTAIEDYLKTPPADQESTPPPEMPNAASTEEPKQFTPPPAPSEVLPEVKIHE